MAQTRSPGSTIQSAPRAWPQRCPSNADVMHLAAAAGSGAAVLVTNNTKDFEPAVPPAVVIEPTVMTADGFFCRPLDEGFDEDLVHVINAMISANRRPPQTWDAMIQRLATVGLWSAPGSPPIRTGRVPRRRSRTAEWAETRVKQSELGSAHGRLADRSSHGTYSICLAGEETDDVVGCVTIGTRNAMAVDVQGARRAGVAKSMRDGHDVNTVGEHLSCHEGAQVVQPELADTSTASMPDEGLGHPVRRPRCSTIGVGGEDERLSPHGARCHGLTPADSDRQVAARLRRRPRPGRCDAPSSSPTAPDRLKHPPPGRSAVPARQALVVAMIQSPPKPTEVHGQTMGRP